MAFYGDLGAGGVLARVGDQFIVNEMYPTESWSYTLCSASLLSASAGPSAPYTYPDDCAQLIPCGDAVDGCYGIDGARADGANGTPVSATGQLAIPFDCTFSEVELALIVAQDEDGNVYRSSDFQFIIADVGAACGPE
jgi:hypothetical protein